MGDCQSKRGVGKTTLSVNLAAISARILGPGRVLLIDTDSQGDTTSVFLDRNEVVRMPRRSQEHGFMTLVDVLEGACRLADAAVTVELPAIGKKFGSTTLDIVPSHDDLRFWEQRLQTGLENLDTLRNMIATVSEGYDLVILDCPPNPHGFFVNAMIAATGLVVPFTPGNFEVGAIATISENLQVYQSRNPDLEIVGFVPNKVDNTVLARDVLALIIDEYGEEYILPGIQDRVAIGEAHTFNLDVFSYQPRSKSAKQFVSMTQEVLARIELIERPNG